MEDSYSGVGQLGLGDGDVSREFVCLEGNGGGGGRRSGDGGEMERVELAGKRAGFAGSVEVERIGVFMGKKGGWRAWRV